MSTKPRHIIRKLAIELHCPRPETGRALYNQLSETLQYKVGPDLEALFDQMGDIRLERLELDLGVLPAKNWEAALRERLLEQCAQSLSAVAKQPGSSEALVTKQGSEHPVFQTYLFFLQTGRLPWWAEHRSSQELETTLLQAGVLDDPAATEALATLLKNQANALRRLVSQAGTALLQALWKRLTERKKRQTGRLKLNSPDWDQLPTSAGARQAGLESFATLLKAGTAELPKKTGSKKKTVQQPKTDPAATDDAVFVPNAGIVLLHPFLSPFFQQLGLVDKKKFPGIAEQEQAVQWLHFLATGSRECPEPELVLPKILCNLPEDHPVTRWFAPEQEQMKIAEKLLTSAIAHWAALKSTKPDGLREGFLQRTGKLESRADGSCKLTMERQTQDVLLEQLPWNISLLRLPWMTQILFVEW